MMLVRVSIKPFITLLCLSTLFVWSCSPNSYEEFHDEGERAIHCLLTELQNVETREDLLYKAPRLRKTFDDIANTVIAAREYQRTHPHHEPLALSPRRRYLNDLLRAELNRIYESIYGGRTIIEECQFEALNVLDSYEKKCVDVDIHKR